MLMNKPVCFGLSILEISKIVVYEFWYDYMKPGKIMLHRYRQLYSLRKNRIHLRRYVKDIETRFDT